MMTKNEVFQLNTSQIVILAIFIITGIVFTFSAIELSNTVQTYTKTQDDISSLQDIISQNSLTAANFKKLTIDKSWLTGSLPTQDTLVNWIQQMDIIAQNSHVTQSLTLSNADLTKNNILVPASGAGGSTPLVGASVVLNGSYNNILSYMMLLKTSYYYVKVTSVSFSGSGATAPTASAPAPTPTNTPTAGTITAVINMELFVDSIAVQPIN